MDKGIRPFCNALFLNSLPARVNTREGNTAFRKNIIAECMEAFDIKLASAATHYNHAFINARELAATDATVAAALEGLGRADDKKGGRKPKDKPAVPATAPSALLENMLKARAGAVQADETAQAVEEATQDDAAAEAAETEVKYSVAKVSDGTVVCSDLTLDEANALIAKAAAAKKAKLQLVA